MTLSVISFPWQEPKVACYVSISEGHGEAYFCHLGLALAPWGVLAGGHIRTDEEEERRRQTGENGMPQSHILIDRR